jgi:hypothetical protein
MMFKRRGNKTECEKEKRTKKGMWMLKKHLWEIQ